MEVKFFLTEGNHLPYTGLKIRKFEQGGFMYLIIRFLINVAAILIIAHIFPKLIQVEGFGAALIAALVLGIINVIIRPILVLLTFPVTLLTLGLFLFVINALMLWLAATIVPGFKVNGFWGAFLGSILISVVSWVFSAVLPGK
jgi:putative membrane protein